MQLYFFIVVFDADQLPSLWGKSTKSCPHCWNAECHVTPQTGLVSAYPTFKAPGNESFQHQVAKSEHLAITICALDLLFIGLCMVRKKEEDR